MTQAEIGDLIHAHGLWITFLLTVIEGPIVTITAGALAGKGLLPAPMVLLVACLGDLVGDIILYTIGRASPRLTRHLAGARVSSVRLGADKLRNIMHGQAWQILVLGKLTHVLGFAVILAAGVARVPFGLFVVISTLATLPKVAILCAVGYIFGQAFDLQWFAGSVPVLITAVVAFAAGLLALHKWRAA